MLLHLCWRDDPGKDVEWNSLSLMCQQARTIHQRSQTASGGTSKEDRGIIERSVVEMRLLSATAIMPFLQPAICRLPKEGRRQRSAPEFSWSYYSPVGHTLTRLRI